MVVKVEGREVQWKALVLSIDVESRTHNAIARTVADRFALRGVVSFGAVSPIDHVLARRGDALAEREAEVAGERAQSLIDLESTEKVAQCLLRAGVEILSDTAEEVQLARGDGDSSLEWRRGRRRLLSSRARGHG